MRRILFALSPLWFLASPAIADEFYRHSREMVNGTVVLEHGTEDPTHFITFYPAMGSLAAFADAYSTGTKPDVDVCAGTDGPVSITPLQRGEDNIYRGSRYMMHEGAKRTLSYYTVCVFDSAHRWMDAAVVYGYNWSGIETVP